MAGRRYRHEREPECSKGAPVKLLLDCHIPKTVVVTLSRRCAGLEVVHLAEWRGGAFRAAQDADVLAACFEERRTLVTYDHRSIPGLLRCWAAEERPHAGVVFGDSTTVPANDPSAVARALRTLVEETGGADMTDGILYLRPARS